MKIESGKGIGAAPGGRGAGQTAAPGFAVAAESAPRAAPAASTNNVASLDAILALQAEAFDPERRKRQTRRGAEVLDALEELVRALAMGRAPAGLVKRLEQFRRGAEMTGVAGLDAVLLEIDTRLAVELAKLELAAAA